MDVLWFLVWVFVYNGGERSLESRMIRLIKRHAEQYQDEPIDDRILAVMSKLDRQDFGGTEEDKPCSIGYGQTISQPFMVAMMTDMVINEARNFQFACEIGAGSGYQVAILSEFFDHVLGIERVGPLAKSARQRLSHLGYTKVEIRHASGWSLEESHLDVLMATCGVLGEIPDSWIKSLQQGGLLLLPYAKEDVNKMALTLWQKSGGNLKKITRHKLPLYCRFVPFIRDLG